MKIQMGLQMLWRFLRAPVSTRQWQILLLTDTPLDAVIERGVYLQEAAIFTCPSWFRFWADPCVAKDPSGSLWVFVEEFQRHRGIGQIVGLEIEGDRIVQRVTVLGGPHHRAFPQVWQHGGKWLASVDGCETPSPIYCFNKLGDPWAALSNSSIPSHLTDPAVGVANDVIQVVGTNWMVDESSAVEVWECEDLDDSIWAQRRDLTYRDRRFGRGAGNVDLSRGFRSVQDGVATYGASVSLISWPVVDDQLKPVVRIDGEDLNATGTHTLAWSSDGQSVVLDAWTRRLDPLGWLWKLTDLYHLRRCRRRMLRSK